MRHFNSHPCLSSKVSPLRAATGLWSAVDLSVPWVERFLLPQQSILSRFIDRVSLSANYGSKKEPEEDLGPARIGAKGSGYHLSGGGSAEVTVSYLEERQSKRQRPSTPISIMGSISWTHSPLPPTTFLFFSFPFPNLPRIYSEKLILALATHDLGKKWVSKPNMNSSIYPPLYLSWNVH